MTTWCISPLPYLCPLCLYLKMLAARFCLFVVAHGMRGWWGEKRRDMLSLTFSLLSYLYSPCHASFCSPFRYYHAVLLCRTHFAGTAAAHTHWIRTPPCISCVSPHSPTIHPSPPFSCATPFPHFCSSLPVQVLSLSSTPFYHICVL